MTSVRMRDRLRDLQPDLDRRWTASVRGQEVLQEVLASQPHRPPPARSTKLKWTAGAVAAITACALAVAVIFGPIDTPSVMDGGRQSSERASGMEPGFDSMNELVDESRVIVVGGVQVAEQGEPGTCPDIPDSECVPWNIELSVTEQLLGDNAPDELIVTFLGHVTETARDLPVSEGDHVAYFLNGRANGHYRAVSAFPAIVIRDDGTVVARSGDRLSDKLDGESWPDVRKQILAAIR